MHIFGTPIQTEVCVALQPLKCPFSSWLQSVYHNFQKEPNKSITKI